MAEEIIITQKIEYTSEWSSLGTRKLPIDFEKVRASINNEYKGQYIVEGEPYLSISETHIYVSFKVREYNKEAEEGPLPIHVASTKFKL